VNIQRGRVQYHAFLHAVSLTFDPEAMFSLAIDSRIGASLYAQGLFLDRSDDHARTPRAHIPVQGNLQNTGIG
jgi:hypothetical protein